MHSIQAVGHLLYNTGVQRYNLLTSLNRYVCPYPPAASTLIDIYWHLCARAFSTLQPTESLLKPRAHRRRIYGIYYTFSVRLYMCGGYIIGLFVSLTMFVHRSSFRCHWLRNSDAVSGSAVNVTALFIGTWYPVIHCERVDTKYGSSVRLTLRGCGG